MISVITPVYNGERFIEYCIKNVIDQACPGVEHIIMDGGSTDKTPDIIKQYSERYSHIRWVSEKDKGQSDAMNKGLALAKGEIIGVLNVDDFYEPNTLNRILEIFQDLPEPSLVVGNCNCWNDNNEIGHINKPSDLRITSLLSEKSHFPYNPSAYFYHKSLHKKIGLYKVDEHYTMDLDFLIKAIKTAKVKYVNETWGNYRHIQGTKTRTRKDNGEYYIQHQAFLRESAKQLPLTQFLQVFMYRRSMGIKYYLKNPQELLPKLKTTFKRALS